MRAVLFGDADAERGGLKPDSFRTSLYAAPFDCAQGRL